MATQSFTSLRTTEPDWLSLEGLLKSLDASASVVHMPWTPIYTVTKSTSWLQAHINAAQNVIDTSPAVSPELTAQAFIDSMPIFYQAIILTLLDQINLIRSNLPIPLPSITVPQMIAAVRTKAGTL